MESSVTTWWNSLGGRLVLYSMATLAVMRCINMELNDSTIFSALERNPAIRNTLAACDQSETEIKKELDANILHFMSQKTSQRFAIVACETVSIPYPL